MCWNTAYCENANLDELISRDVATQFKPPRYKTAFVTHKKDLQHNGLTDNVSTHKLSIERHGDNISYNWSNVDLGQFRYDKDKDAIESIRDYYARVMSIKPSFIVSTKGDFIKNTNSHELYNKALATGSKIFDQTNPSIHETYLAFMEEANKQEFSDASVATFWYYLVEAWKGKELLHDIATVSETTKPEPLFDGTPIPRKRTLTNMGTVPCGGVNELLYCVELELRDNVDTDKYKEVLKPYLEKHNIETKEALEIINYQDDYTVSVISLPDNLTPYYLHVSHIFASRYITNGEQKDVYVFNRDQYTFTYVE
jgi:hypothetical protein